MSFQQWFNFSYYECRAYALCLISHFSHPLRIDVNEYAAKNTHRTKTEKAFHVIGHYRNLRQFTRISDFN